MRALPLFHRVAGRPVMVLGDGDGAEPKRRLVERAGGAVITDMATGIAAGARLAFVAHDDAARCEADAARLRAAGLLVNVVDRPELCDFTTPSLLERDPILIAIGSDGTSAGLVKQLRLRLEGLLPPGLGQLALTLQSARGALRRRWPTGAERRRALDAALAQGGVLDLLQEGAAARVDAWLADANAGGAPATTIDLVIASDDPDDLTLRQARLLGTADVLLVPPGFPPKILARARADAIRLAWDDVSSRSGVILRLRRAG